MTNKTWDLFVPKISRLIRDLLIEKSHISFFIWMHWITMFLRSLIVVAAGAPEATVQTGIELGSECVEPRVPTLSNG